jgi:hypothetical protein
MDKQSPVGRVLVWFSCGATSAVAAKLALAEWPTARVIRIRIGSEHPDADRFANDVGKWLRRPIGCLTPPYADHLEVIRKYRYVNGPTGAKCSGELKRKVREVYQEPGDLHVFGFDSSESNRLEDFRENYPAVNVDCPLIRAGLDHSDCKLILERAGIELHLMYRLGYGNANCVGCVKGGAGYWNKIRKDFPERFWEMAGLEREIGGTILKYRSGPRKGERLFLDELQPDAGNFKEDMPGDCGPICQVALERIGIK